jgi:hypothetical protein
MSGVKYQSLSRDRTWIALTPRDAKNPSPKPSRPRVRLSVYESKVTMQNGDSWPVRALTRRSALR